VSGQTAAWKLCLAQESRGRRWGDPRGGGGSKRCGAGPPPAKREAAGDADGANRVQPVSVLHHSQQALPPLLLLLLEVSGRRLASPKAVAAGSRRAIAAGRPPAPAQLLLESQVVCHKQDQILLRCAQLQGVGQEALEPGAVSRWVLAVLVICHVMREGRQLSQMRLLLLQQASMAGNV
jgi:hypothetical protein